MSLYNSYLRARKTTETFWRVRIIYIVDTCLRFLWNLCKIILLREEISEINKKSKFVHSDAEARWFWKEILWLFHDFLTFDMRASQRNQAYQIKPLKKFLSWICHRFSNPNAGFDATNVLISHLFALWQFFFSQIWSPTQKNFTLFKVFTRASWQSLLWFVQSWCRVTNSGYYLKRNQTKLENTLTILTFFNKNKVSIKKIWQNNFHGVFEFWLWNDFWLGTLKMKDQQNWTVFYYLT